MFTRDNQQKGGQIMAERQKQAAADLYNQNPNHCLYCGKIIELLPGRPPSRTRTKKFCGQSCAASFNNNGVNRYDAYDSYKRCSVCGERITSRATKCKQCIYADTSVASSTKKELRLRRSHYNSSRAAIRRHASDIYGQSDKPRCCAICGYETHIDVCHIRPVSDFSGDATITEINDPDNLIALCPNHHWEYDHGLLALP